MATNKSGTYVHVHGEGGGTTVVAPGESFPEGFKATSDLTDEPDENEDLAEVPGPGQFPAHVRRGPADAEPKQWNDYKVPELREKLAAAGVDYDEGDRKDALVAKAEAAGLDPNAAGGEGGHRG